MLLKTTLLQTCKSITDEAADLCTQVERQFLRTLEGGCTAPIGAHAQINNDEFHFKGCLHSLDGTQEKRIETSIALNALENHGAIWARELLAEGGAEIMEEIKKEL